MTGVKTTRLPRLLSSLLIIPQPNVLPKRLLVLRIPQIIVRARHAVARLRSTTAGPNTTATAAAVLDRLPACHDTRDALSSSRVSRLVLFRITMVVTGRRLLMLLLLLVLVVTRSPLLLSTTTRRNLET